MGRPCIHICEMECYLADTVESDPAPMESRKGDLVAPNPEDLARQRRCIEELAARKGNSFTETQDPMAHYDATLHDPAGNDVCLVEFKGRNVPVLNYDGVTYFRENKVEWLIQEGTRQALPTLILIEFTDGLYWITPEEVVTSGELVTTRGRGLPEDPDEVSAWKLGVVHLHELRRERPREEQAPPKEHDWLLD